MKPMILPIPLPIRLDDSK
jgi:hypothetical protein